jgi:hypothetical protein
MDPRRSASSPGSVQSTFNIASFSDWVGSSCLWQSQIASLPPQNTCVEDTPLSFRLLHVPQNVGPETASLGIATAVASEWLVAVAMLEVMQCSCSKC